ncbi:Somatostatin receptor type 4 [Exaiptasia diaphana]|nr:Somatostatin receptor type 4 [Exaiptasia diaphana]
MGMSGASLLGLNVGVLATVRKHKHNTKMTLQRNQRRLSPEEGRVTGILVAVVLGFVFCWVPVYCVWMLNLYEITMPRRVHKFAALFAALSSCINPIIYGLLNRELRAEFKKILSCKHLSCQCNIVHPT